MQSKAATVEQYLAELPDDRRTALQAVRRVILDSLDKDFEEGMQYGMIGYYVPHRIHPAGYHCDPRQPLPFGGLTSQKNYMSLHLMGLYGGTEEETRFRAAWAKTGKKLDMGKCCIRFKKLDDLALDVIAESIRRMPAKKYIERFTKAVAERSAPVKRTAAKKAAARSPKSAKPAKSTKSVRSSRRGG